MQELTTKEIVARGAGAVVTSSVLVGVLSVAWRYRSTILTWVPFHGGWSALWNASWFRGWDWMFWRRLTT